MCLGSWINGKSIHIVWLGKAAAQWVCKSHKNPCRNNTSTLSTSLEPQKKLDIALGNQQCMDPIHKLHGDTVHQESNGPQG